MSIGRAHTVSLFWLNKHSFQPRSIWDFRIQETFETQLFYALMDLGFYPHTDRKQQSGTA